MTKSRIHWPKAKYKLISSEKFRSYKWRFLQKKGIKCAILYRSKWPKSELWHYCIKATYVFLRLLRAGKAVNMCWVPSHVGIAGNERADAKAREIVGHGRQSQPWAATSILLSINQESTACETFVVSVQCSVLCGNFSNNNNNNNMLVQILKYAVYFLKYAFNVPLWWPRCTIL